MLVEIVIHVMFQVMLATIVFWCILIPTCKDAVKLHVRDTISLIVADGQLLKNGEKELINAVLPKSDIIKLLSLPDPYAYQMNTRVMMMNQMILISILIIGFTFVVYFACETLISPILVELLVTYAIVFTGQLLFVKYIISNFYPTSESEMIEQITKSINTTCNVLIESSG